MLDCKAGQNSTYSKMHIMFTNWGFLTNQDQDNYRYVLSIIRLLAESKMFQKAIKKFIQNIADGFAT